MMWLVVSKGDFVVFVLIIYVEDIVFCEFGIDIFVIVIRVVCV